MHRPVGAAVVVGDTAAGVADMAEVSAEAMEEASVEVTSGAWVEVLVEAVSAAWVEGSAQAEPT
jgi:hypothetical protein